MSIRWKVLALTLTIAIVPVLLTSWFNIRGLSTLGSRLAEQSGQALSDHARSSLERLADDYARIMNRESQLVELLLRLQKREVERLLAGPDPAMATIYFQNAFDDGDDDDLDLQVHPEKYFRIEDDGRRISIPVSLTHQVFRLAPGIRAADVEADARRLAPMSEFYAAAHRHHGDIVYWQYTALENGLSSSFPGHGGYPVDFDTRKRFWYMRQKEMQHFQWSRPLIDVSSRLALAGANMPIYGPDGRFAGVTGIDIRLTSILQSLRLPSHLAPASHVLMTFAVQPPLVDTARMVVIARQNQAEHGGDWNELPAMEPFLTDDAGDNERLLADMLALEDGFLRTSYRGEDVFCLYRAFDEANAGFLVFLVPAAAAVGPAMAAADYALKSTSRQIDALVPIMVALVLAVAVIAFFSSRAITGPVSRLSQAVDKVAGGDFSVRTDIRTGDEFQHLGEAFNAMVPQLEKHAQVREAMALAREVQQHLLPHGAPAIKGLDIAGFSLYCDQTGGDYYDFIDMHEHGTANIGIAVGDVSGHGLPSALLMTTVRALLHGSANRLVSPPDILQHINHHLVDDLLGGRFMTLFYLLVDVENRTFNWASAGHDPAIRYDPVKNVFSELSGRDIPLGIDPDWRYEAIERDRYGQEEIVVLGTDGIWDSRSPDGHPFGKARLREIIRAHATYSAERICQQIVDELAAFRGNRTQHDDVTGVVLRVTEGAG